MSSDKTLHTSGAVAERVRIQRWRLLYLIERGDLPAPSFQVPGRRLFTGDDIRRIEAVLAARPGLRGHEHVPRPDVPPAEVP